MHALMAVLNSQTAVYPHALIAAATAFWGGNRTPLEMNLEETPPIYLHALNAAAIDWVGSRMRRQHALLAAYNRDGPLNARIDGGEPGKDTKLM